MDNKLIKYAAVITLIGLMALGIAFLLLKVNEVYQQELEARCSYMFFKEAVNMESMRFLCNNNECKSYFENRIYSYLNKSKECLE